jgi:ribonuclease HII
MKEYIIGIDEVGRGPLAGPVMVAALAMPISLKIDDLRDSKALTEFQREEWFEWLSLHPEIKYEVAQVSPLVIDRINITQAANLAATRAYKKLNMPGFVILDGGLKLNISSGVNFQTIIKADERYDCVKLASIAAKVLRDRLMKRYHKIYPQFGFDRNKGYGTEEHLAALISNGKSPLHRNTFLKKILES